MSKLKKEISFLYWILDLLPDEVVNKAFFGGRAFYLNDKIILAVFENPGDRQYKDKIADFDIWCGCLFPTEYENQAEVLRRYPDLVRHPILPKWLYLPSSDENFEEKSTKLIKLIVRGSPLFGAIPNRKKVKNNNTSMKKTKKIVSNKSTSKKIDFKKIELIDMKTPRMFSDSEPAEHIIAKAQKISDLKNLGPTSEKHFESIGIKTAKQLVKLGWKKAMKKLVERNPKHRHSIYAYALIGALKNQEWSRISDEDKKEARDFTQSLKKLTIKKQK